MDTEYGSTRSIGRICDRDEALWGCERCRVAALPASLDFFSWGTQGRHPAPRTQRIDGGALQSPCCSLRSLACNPAVPHRQTVTGRWSTRTLMSNNYCRKIWTSAVPVFQVYERQSLSVVCHVEDADRLAGSSFLAPPSFDCGAC